jgi:hypothetical protein
MGGRCDLRLRIAQHPKLVPARNWTRAHKVQRFVRNPKVDWMGATLDGMVPDGQAVFIKRAHELNADPELLIAFAPVSSSDSGPTHLP